MSTADRPGPGTPAQPGPLPEPEPDLPVGAQGGYPPPPPLEGGDDEPGPGPEAESAAGTNTMAVLGLVFAFLLPVLGVVFSAVALVQTRRRAQAGHGLAVAGLVVSLVLVAAAAVVLATVGTTPFRTVGAQRAGVGGPVAVAPASPSVVPAGDPADEAVVSACSSVMPAMTQLEGDLGSAASVDDVGARVAALQQRVGAAAAGSGDAGFAAHARALAADFGRLVDAARGGGDPAALVGDIEQDGMALGQDCGSAGWLP
jgi:Domain of unknown function (DUF4190)